MSFRIACATAIAAVVLMVLPVASAAPDAPVGPAATILILTALGVTITFRSWHEDVRRQRDQFRRWRHGASAHAGKA